jgi:hypothetical protein
METAPFPVARSFEPEYQQEHGFSCVISPTIECEFTTPMPSGDEVIIRIPVSVAENASGVVTNSATVEGGGVASPVSTSEPATVPNSLNGTSPSTFGIQDFNATAYGPNGEQDVQAGDHPYAFTTRFNLTSKVDEEHEEGRPYSPVEEVKEVKVDLPLGLIGDPLAAPQCKETDLTKGAGETGCPAASRVGTIDAELGGSIASSLGEGGVTNNSISAVYNMVPEKGYPAVFGFNLVRVGVLLYATVVHTSSGYDLQVKVPGVVRTTEPEGTSLTFFGDPGQRDGGATPETAFFSNPVNCAAGPLTARIEADSWFQPGNWIVKETSVYPQMTGCNMLQFDPEIEVKPETTQADGPAGYEVDLKIPQTANAFPNLATPELKNATVTLPEGVALSPSAADGLVGCQETGPEGIEIPQGDQEGSRLGPGEEIGPDGLPRLAPGHCPAASEIGEVEATTPVLPHALHGNLYLARPRCGAEGQPQCSEADATNGGLYGLYLEVSGEGVVIKLKGTASANTRTGQLTTRFEETPQLPFSELRLRLKGGARAPLANPQTCGQATTTSALTPWSAPESGPPATPFSSFAVGGCAGESFNPGFLAQSETPLAGGSTPFTVQFSRNDREQDLGGITVTTPPGLLGEIATVPLCNEPQAQDGQCSSASQIGTATVAAGAGSHPFWLSGAVYLTGPYKGAPFGLSVVVPEKAGPFDLGEEVVRSAIRIDPSTGQITVTSDPLPQIKDGVPFRLKTVNVTINRPGFMFNPTNCEAAHVNGTIVGEHPIGSSEAPKSVQVATPFAAAGCKNLPFKPGFSVSTQAKTSKANGASLVVKLTQKPGEANIHKVDLQLPLALPSRLSTLQKACTEVQFNADPAGCPAGSVIGTATAHTPVLQAPLTGPAYLVSHGGAAFPDVEFVLQADERGGEVEIVLDGKTQIKKGITYSHFETVPDAPISSFETSLPEGPHSALAAFGNLCAQNLVMPTTIVGQNGAQVKQSTKVSVTGCKAVTISKRTLAGTSVVLAFNVTTKGTVTVTGYGLKRYRKTISAGFHQIKVTLSKAGLSARRHHRKITIRVTLKTGSKTSSATTALRL